MRLTTNQGMTIPEYNKCVEVFSDNLYRFILKNLKNEEQAKDVVQDSFTKMWLKVEEVDFQKAKSYLFTTGYRTMIDLIRREQKRGDIEKADMNKLADHSQYSDLQEILHKAIARLPETQQHVIMLRDYEGYSYDEIGEITDLNPAQVKVYIYRARVSLKKYLVKMDYLL